MRRVGAALQRTSFGSPPAGGCRLARLLAPLIAAVSLAACASISEKMAGTLSEAPAIGAPAGAPVRPTDPPAYPAVHDMPPVRNSPTLTGIEQKKFEDDLVAARSEQQRLTSAPQEPQYIAPDSAEPRRAAKPVPKPAAKKTAKPAAKPAVQKKLMVRAAPRPDASRPPAPPLTPVTSARTIY